MKLLKAILGKLFKRNSRYFSRLAICYNYAFDLGHPVNPIDAARQLLKADYVGGFLNPVTEEGEVADQFGPITAKYDKYLKVKQLLSQIKPGSGPWPYIKLLLTDPVHVSPALLRGLRQIITQEGLDQGMVDAEEKLNTSDAGVDQFTQAAGDLTGVLLGNLAVQLAADYVVFHEDYLEEPAFVRISLRPCTVRTGSEDLDLAMSVTVHRTGVAIFSAWVTPKDATSVQDVLQLVLAGPLTVQSCDIPSTIANRYFSLFFGKLGKSDLRLFNDEYGVKDRPGYLRFDGETTLSWLFEAYRYAITETVRGRRYHTIGALFKSLRAPQYFGYPIVFIGCSAIDTVSALTSQQADDVAHLILGLQISARLRQSKVGEVLGDDLSIGESHSLYITEGGTINLFYGNSGNEIPDFTTVSVIHTLILQKVFLTICSEQLAQTTLDPSGLERLNEIKQDLLSLLEEYHALGLSHYGSVHEIIRHGQDALRIADLRSLLDQRLTDVESLVQVAQGKRRASRDRFIKILVTVTAAVFSLPTADRIVQMFERWTGISLANTPRWMQGAIMWFGTRAHTEPVRCCMIVYLAMLFAVLSPLALEGLLRRSKTRRRAIPAPPQIKSKARMLAPLAVRVEIGEPAEEH